ncbi:MAG: hydrogenase maturation protease [Myxococcota bacterium]
MAFDSIGVLGLGNVLMGDDAFGPWVISWLRARYVFPDRVVVEDLGTPGLDLYPHLVAHQAVILVDTVRASATPGTIRRYDDSEILRHPPGPRVSPHDPGLKEALSALRLAGTGPRSVVLIGAVPEVVAYGVGLTRAVQDAVPRAADHVRRELLLLQITGITDRREPEPVEPWWEQSRGFIDES